MFRGAFAIGRKNDSIYRVAKVTWRGDLFDMAFGQTPYRKDLYSRDSSPQALSLQRTHASLTTQPASWGASLTEHYVKMHSALVLIPLFSLAAAMQPVESSIFDSKALQVGGRTPARP